MEVQVSSCRPDGHNGSIYTDGYKYLLGICIIVL